MGRANSAWFEAREIEGKRYPSISKFSRADFVVPVDFVRSHWRWWSRRQKGLFAAAFAEGRVKLIEGDREVVDFLIEKW
jgi:hypothetical protein